MLVHKIFQLSQKLRMLPLHCSARSSSMQATKDAGARYSTRDCLSQNGYGLWALGSLVGLVVVLVVLLIVVTRRQKDLKSVPPHGGKKILNLYRHAAAKRYFKSVSPHGCKKILNLYRRTAAKRS